MTPTPETRVVPMEPTTAMLAAGQAAWLADPMRRSSTLYRAMLAAAPAAPAQEPVAYQRRHMWPSAAGARAPWEQCPKAEATGHFEKRPGYEYRVLYAAPPAPVAASAKEGK